MPTGGGGPSLTAHDTLTTSDLTAGYLRAPIYTPRAHAYFNKVNLGSVSRVFFFKFHCYY